MKIQPKTRTSHWSYPHKLISLISLSFVFCNQVLPAHAEISLLSPPQDTEDHSLPTQSINEPVIDAVAPPLNFKNLENSLIEESPLKLIDEAPIEEKASSQNYITEIYETAADGIDEIQEGTAVAYLAKDLTNSDLHELRQLSSEVGLLVVDGLVVIFSTGDEHFIRNLPPVKSLLENNHVLLSQSNLFRYK